MISCRSSAAPRPVGPAACIKPTSFRQLIESFGEYKDEI